MRHRASSFCKPFASSSIPIHRSLWIRLTKSLAVARESKLYWSRHRFEQNFFAANLRGISTKGLLHRWQYSTAVVLELPAARNTPASKNSGTALERQSQNDPAEPAGRSWGNGVKKGSDRPSQHATTRDRLRVERQINLKSVPESAVRYGRRDQCVGIPTPSTTRYPSRFC